MLKIPIGSKGSRWPSLLFDLQADPGQTMPLEDAAVESRMQALLIALMRENDAPAEQYARLGLAQSL